MTILNVRHTTVYRYRRPVRLGDHRLMLRPRDSRDLRLIGTNLNFSPTASLHWIHDVFGNPIAIASFTEPAATGRFPKLSREEAYMIASVSVDYHVTQAVDGTKGIHGMIPKSIFAGR